MGRKQTAPPELEVGGYRLLERIGRGGMAEVWCAEHLLLGRRAAVKLIPPEAFAGSKESARTVLRRFEREARATSTLGSPHTIQLYDFGITKEGSFFYAMELLDGIDLRTLVQRHGPMTAERVVHVLPQVCESLGEAHYRGLVHRDVKPANVILARVGLEHDFVKVLDFGLVRRTSDRDATADLTAENFVSGTPGFMAPETIRGGASDHRVDVYAFGCLAYWLLAGRLVFEGESALEIMTSHLERDPERPSRRAELEIPSALEEVVMECLEKDPEARPGDLLSAGKRIAEIPLRNRWSSDAAAEWWRIHHPETTYCDSREDKSRDEPSVLRVKRPRSFRRASLSTLPLVTIGAVLAGVVLFTVAQLLRHASRDDRAVAASPSRLDIPSIAVLPFDNLSRDPEQEYLCDGLTEDVITDLSKVPRLRVTARNTVFTYKDKPVDVRRIADDLGVSYVLEGSVQRAAESVRVNAQLIDATTGLHLWADRYDRRLVEIFKLQDEIVDRIVTSLQIELTEGEQAGVRRATTTSVEAWELYNRALAAFRTFRREENARARRLLEEALAIDPRFASAVPALADTYLVEAFFGWADSREATLDRASEIARHGIELDSELGEPHAVIGLVHSFRGEHALAIEHGQRGVELDDTSEDTLGSLACILVSAGRPAEGLAYAQRAVRLSRSAPPSWIAELEGDAYYAMGRYDDAARAYERVLAIEPDFLTSRVSLVAAYCAAGQLKRASREAERVKRLDPGFTVDAHASTLWHRGEQFVARLVADLRRAGLA
jgi:TolB-like protein/tRNA A-37 threonylcarbamoyl transferase component Bud32